MENQEADVAAGGQVEPTAEEQAYEQAKMRAGAKLGFYIHFGIYMAVNALLAIVNLLTLPGNLWFVWPLAGWGVGVVIHGLVVFATTSRITERMIAKELKRDSEAE